MTIRITARALGQSMGALVLLAGLSACGGEAPADVAVAPEAAPPTEPVLPTEAPTEAAAHEGEAPHWAYTGEAGADHWAELSPEFEACGAGEAQSPIDIAGAEAADLANITFAYGSSKVNILNNGHTVQVNYDPGSGIELDGTHYDLAQFHLHAPSEHSIAGDLADAELHLVHKSADGKLAVVGVLIEEGAENEAFATTWAHLPAVEGPVETVDAEVMAADFLPADATTYRYAGSLTTPPCSEGVAWNVMTTPITMSAEQLAAFTSLFEGGNNRPVQPLGDRELEQDTSP